MELRNLSNNNNVASTITVTKSNVEGYEYSIRVEYHTRIFIEKIKDTNELASKIHEYLYGNELAKI